MLRLLSECSLFEGVEGERITELLEEAGYTARSYARGDIPAIQNARYNHMMILTEGLLTAETTDSSNRQFAVEYIAAPALIAPSYLFAPNNLLPVTLVCSTTASVITIDRGSFLDMIMSDRRVSENFLAIVSSPNKFVSEKVVYLTYKTIKSKFSNYLLNMMSSESNVVLRNRLTQREMADLFGVTRPALARAVGELVAEGTIYVKGKEITVLFAEKLRQYAKS